VKSVSGSEEALDAVASSERWESVAFNAPRILNAAEQTPESEQVQRAESHPTHRLFFAARRRVTPKSRARQAGAHQVLAFEDDLHADTTPVLCL
jgi:hypothetical protein